MTPATLLRHLRTTAGLTQRDLAERVGCSPSHVQKSEREDYGASLDYLLAVAEACGARVMAEIGAKVARETVALRRA